MGPRGLPPTSMVQGNPLFLRRIEGLWEALAVSQIRGFHFDHSPLEAARDGGPSEGKRNVRDRVP